MYVLYDTVYFYILHIKVILIYTFISIHIVYIYSILYKHIKICMLTYICPYFKHAFLCIDTQLQDTQKKESA